jgi:multidrug efflux pump subunit AcrA (membrane-fusion protein)
MRKILIRILALLTVAAAVGGGYRFLQQLQQKQQPVPTATVRKGDVIIRSYTRGELRAVRSAMLVAPNLFGTVQITRLAPLGSFAREKDLIVEFDDSEVQSRLDEKQLELEQLDEQLKMSQANMDIRTNQDQVELLRARFSVRRAQLEVKRNELLSAIDAKKNLLNLDEAQRRLKQLESDVKSRRESSEAELAVLREKKNKALLELSREKQRLSQVKLLAPMSGLVAIRQNRGTFFMMRGMQLPDLREGDQVFPGLPVADVLDLSELEVAAKVSELDRANLHDGQDVTIRLDAVPDKIFHGQIKTLSGTATANIWSGDVAKKFDVMFSVGMKELLTGLGAKPDQIKKVLETAERNRSRPQAGPMAAMAPAGAIPGPEPGGMPGGAPGGGGSAVTMVRAGTPSSGESGGQGGGQGRMMRMGAGLSPEDQTKLREAAQKILNGRNPQDLSSEDRQKMFEQMRTLMQSMAGGAKPEAGASGASAQAGAVRAFGPAPGPGGPAGASLPPGFGMGSTPRFNAKDLENAQLPAAPEESSQLEVLLRPGLLADVEIIVEKIPNAIHIPVQAVFEKDGKPIVYVKSGNQFEERLIKPLKRSESTMVIAEGLKPGEVLALTDPNAKKGGKKEAKAAGGKGPAVPAAGAGAGARP